MCSQTSCEQTIPIGNMYHGFLRRSRHRQTSRYTFPPQIQVVSGVAYDLRLASRTGRCVDPHDVFHRLCKESRRVIGCDIFFRDERQLRDIIQRLDIFRFHTGFIHLIPIVRYVIIRVLYGLLQFLQLNGPHGVAIRTFHFLVPNHGSVVSFRL